VKYTEETRIATKSNEEVREGVTDGNLGYEVNHQYWYHGDHLGSAQLVTNRGGELHERLEYTPYGEVWIEHKYESAEGSLPYRFTGKELDEETGFYYYGARYLDPRTSRWISGDPAMGEYIPSAPVNEEAKKRNGNLPGMGGVYNVINLHTYHYAGNNPLKYTDPDGEQTHPGVTALNQYMTDVSQYNKAVEDATSEINDRFSQGNALGKIIDTLFLGGKYAQKAEEFQRKVTLGLGQAMNDAFGYLTRSGFIAPDENGCYSMEEAGIFAEMVNNTMSLNYSIQSDLGSYSVAVPEISPSKAFLYLNHRDKPILGNPSLLMPKLPNEEGTME
jgi:RHS repeat-associated protein